MANPCQVCEEPQARRYGVPPREDFRARFMEHPPDERMDETEPESTGTRPRHLESTSCAITHQSRLESTSSGLGVCLPTTLLGDDVWNPPATPRFHQQAPDKIPDPAGTRVQPYVFQPRLAQPHEATPHTNPPSTRLQRRRSLQHPQVMTMPVRHRMDRKGGKIAHLVHTI